MVTYKNYVATLDIETSDGLKGTKFAVGSFYMPNIEVNQYCVYVEKEYSKNKIELINKTKDVKYIKITDTNEKRFFNRIIEVIKDKRVLIFIHNLDFDIRFLMKYLIDYLKIKPTIIQSSSKILQVMIQIQDTIIRDSLQFLLCSQAQAEETFLGKRIKKEVDFEKTLKDLQSNDKKTVLKAKKILFERVETDVKGLLETIVTFRNLFYNSYAVNLFNFVTLPAFSMALFRKYLKLHFNTTLHKLNPYFRFSTKEGYYWKTNTSKFWYDWVRKSYFGGINEIYNLNYLKDVYYYDENSLYPSVCIKYPFPNPTTSKEIESSIKHPITLREIKELQEEKKLYIIEATVRENCDFPILPVRDIEGRIKFVNGVKTGVWCSPQFDLFLEQENREIIEIIRIRYYEESDYYLKPYMQDSFNKRRETTFEAIQSIEKIKMNALTGKFAQRYEKNQWIMPDEEQLQDKIDCHNDEEIDLIYFNEDYSLIKQNLISFKDFMIVEWTAFITSYSQAVMRKTHYQCKKEGIKIHYTDTDCLFTDKPLELYSSFSNKIGSGILQLKNELINKNMVFNKEKGLYFDLQTNEYVEIPKFDEVKFYQPKVYATKKDGKIKIKAKGISLFMIYSTLNIPLNKDEKSKKLFNEKVKTFQDVENLLINGVSIDRFLKYRSALRRKKELIAHETIQKSMRKIYDKRKILPDLTTIPFTFQEIESSLKLCEAQNLNTLKNNVDMNYVITMENRAKD